jgi:hypothetical protein
VTTSIQRNNKDGQPEIKGQFFNSKWNTVLNLGQIVVKNRNISDSKKFLSSLLFCHFALEPENVELFKKDD